jgi:hypothetical protein
MDFFGEDTGYTKELRLFREIGTKLTKLYGLPDKLSGKVTHCLFVELAKDHPQGTSRVLDLKNKRSC